MVAGSRPDESRRDAIFEHFPEALLIAGAGGQILDANPAAVLLFGYDHDEIVLLNLSDLGIEGRTEAIPNAATVTLQDGVRRNVRARRKDGAPIAVEWGEFPLPELAGATRTLVLRAVSGPTAVAGEPAEHGPVERALRTALNQLQTVLYSASEGILVQDADGRFLYANDAAARLCGFSSAAAMQAATPAEALSHFEVLNEDGAPFPSGDLPTHIALREGRPAEAVIRYRTAGARDDRWSLVRAVPVEDPENPVATAVTVFQDITALKQEEARAQFLAQAGALLAQTLDYEGTLAQIAKLAVPLFADWAAVDVVEADGGIRRLATHHADPAKVAWADELSRRYPTRVNDPSGPARVMRTFQPEFYPTIPQELLDAAGSDEQIVQILRELHLTSSICVPLRIRERALGALTFVYAESERHYTEGDLRFAMAIADRAALALENAGLYRDALAAIHVREEFLSSVSHDLRTPLTTIRGSAQLLLRQFKRTQDAASGRQVTALANIDRAAVRMEAMVGALLDVARLESGRPLEMDRRATDLIALVRGLVEEHQRGAPSHIFLLDASTPVLYGVWDAARIERVVDNLLSNAVKYSPSGDRVRVTVNIEPDPATGAELAVLRVEDDGIGIPAADLPRIFERFHRGSNVPPRTPGIGIGLAGAKQIVELHGGSLDVESDEGTGTRFTLRLPIAPA